MSYSYNYYKYNKNSISAESLPKGYYFDCDEPCGYNIHYLVWQFFSLLKSGKRYRRYLVRNAEGKVVSYAEVICKFWKFRFIPEGGYEIGPCYTIVNERGKGLYPNLLRHIINGNKDKDMYMIVHKNNIASIKGVEKAGFVKFAVGEKNKFGVFCYVN